jgi:hypothetical protein
MSAKHTHLSDRLIFGLASEIGLSASAVAHIIGNRKFKTKSSDQAKLNRSRRVIEDFLDAERDARVGAPAKVAAELATAQRKRRIDRHKRRIDRLIAALAEAEIPSTVSPDLRSVLVHGTRVGLPLSSQRMGHAALMQRITHDALSEHLLGLVCDHLSGFPLQAVPTTAGVVLLKGNRIAARISATQAVISPPTSTRRWPPPVNGNFLARGRHWSSVRETLLRTVPSPSRKPSRDPVGEPASIRIISELPVAVTGELRELAVIASQLIREERTIAFGHSVELAFDAERITFAPIRDGRGAVEAPFHYRSQLGELRAALRLKSPRDPMVIAVEHAGSEEVIARGWVTALVAFADLTCVPQSDSDSDFTTRPRDRPGRSSASPTQATAVRRGQTSISSALTPSAHTAQLLASYVVGHRRKLRTGQRASPEARREAERAGIAVRPNETWVRPHMRGVPDDIVLTFIWTPPAVLVPHALLRAAGP